jgi:hypothetical protein
MLLREGEHRPAELAHQCVLIDRGHDGRGPGM